MQSYGIVAFAMDLCQTMRTVWNLFCSEFFAARQKWPMVLRHQFSSIINGLGIQMRSIRMFLFFNFINFSINTVIVVSFYHYIFRALTWRNISYFAQNHCLCIFKVNKFHKLNWLSLKKLAKIMVIIIANSFGVNERFIIKLTIYGL